jgi:hypothetical protein
LEVFRGDERFSVPLVVFRGGDRESGGVDEAAKLVVAAVVTVSAARRRINEANFESYFSTITLSSSLHSSLSSVSHLSTTQCRDDCFIITSTISAASAAEILSSAARTREYHRVPALARCLSVYSFHA